MNRNNHEILTKKIIDKAERHLRRSDPIMKDLIRRHGHCPLDEYEYRPFHTLVVSIISQQLSAKAADTIQGRLAQVTSIPFFLPESVLSCSTDKLRAAGLSSSKVRYIQELARSVADGRLSFADLEHEEDEFVIETLVELPGIGQWTAEMFLIFGLKRPDVLSLGDAGLQRAAKALYGEREDVSELLKTISDAWRPYRSVASWYLWKHLDG
jgi:DNA-3-methyladenine glycosylase II